MFRYLATPATVFCLLAASVTETRAQIAFRAGGGVYVEDKEPGWHGSIILPFGAKPAGMMIAAEYYKKDGSLTVPVSIRGLYKFSLGDRARMYGGIGSGLIYTQHESDTAVIKLSSTKVLFSAVWGLNVKWIGPIGIFGESTLDRGLSGDAENKYGVKGGIALTLSH